MMPDFQKIDPDSATYRAIVNNLPFYVVFIDRTRTFLWANTVDPTLEESDVLGHKMDEYVPPEVLPTVIDAVEGAFESGESRYWEGPAYGGGTMDTYYATRVVPLPGEEPLALLISNDISPRKKAELAVKESEAYFRAVAESSPDYILMVNQDHCITYLNRDPDPSTGLTREDLIGAYPYSLARGDEAKAAQKAAIQKAFDEGEVSWVESRFALPGDDRYYLTRFVPVNFPGKYKDKPDRAVMLIITDVTETHFAQQKNESLKEQLHQSQKMESVGHLAGGIAHDFNNLLMIIQGHLELLHNDGQGSILTGEGAASLEAALDATYKAADLTRQLLAFSRRSRPVREEFSLGELVINLVAMLKRIIPENISIDVVAHSPALLQADPTRTEQVVTNICLNSRDAMPQGGTITVEVSEIANNPSVTGIAGSQILKLAITDDGPGIPDADKERVFVPFFSTKPTGQGTGLGLAVVKSIVSEHGGKISAQDRPNGVRGTVFEVLLPLKSEGRPNKSFGLPTNGSTANDSPATGKGAAGGPASPTSSASPASPAGSVDGSRSIWNAPGQATRQSTQDRPCILVAEDDSAVRLVLRQILVKAGYVVIEAINGEQAVETFIANQNSIDSCILDMIMPRRSGREAFEAIRRVQPEVPVLFCSGYTDNQLTSEFLQANQARFLQKPFQPKELLEIVRQMTVHGL